MGVLGLFLIIKPSVRFLLAFLLVEDCSAATRSIARWIVNALKPKEQLAAT